MRTRFAFKHGSKPLVLAADHPAVVEGRTIFQSRVKSARDCDRILIGAEHNSKLGAVWKLGWPGTRMFTLTLEERATCPRSCPQYRSCYMNHQHYTVRVRHDAHLIPKLRAELGILAARFPKFSIRLHQGGDFWSVQYARFWMEQLRRFRGLHLFGFTARDPQFAIGRIIAAEKSDRCRIRFSGSTGPNSARVEKNPAVKNPDKAFICLAQSGKKPNCAACGVCLTTTAPVIFKLH